jgi:hypothetical protein
LAPAADWPSPFANLLLDLAAKLQRELNGGLQFAWLSEGAGTTGR